jgi:acetoin utilization protein AcuB
MIASHLTSADIFPLKKSDTCETALVFMSDWKVSSLPVIQEGKLMGYVYSNELNHGRSSDKIEVYLRPLPQLFIFQNQHFFEILTIMNEAKTDVLALCDEAGQYQSAISIHELVRFISKSSLAQQGAILVLSMSPQDYSLSEISRIIEYNDCKILNVFVNSNPDNPSSILVSIKLNKQAVSAVVHTLERYRYTVYGVFMNEDQAGEMATRYDWLIRYLNT